MRKSFIVTKPSDINGFSSFKCSLCREEFKLSTYEVQEDDVLELFCPSCGIPSNISSYYTDDIKEHAAALVEMEIKKLLNDTFKGLEKSARSNKHVKFKAGKPLVAKQPKPLYETDDLDEIEFLCCSKKARVTTLAKAGVSPYCPYCGVN